MNWKNAFKRGKELILDLCSKGNKEYKVKSAILIKVKEVSDLDKIKNII